MREFRILGPLEVADGEEVLSLTGHKQRALLALLLLDANRVVSTDRLVDALWGEQPPRTAATSLQNFVSQLRKLLGSDVLVTKPPGYQLRISPQQLDLDRFVQLVEEARAEDSAVERAEKLRRALAIWRGPPLADLGFEAFAQQEIGRLDELRLAALEDRVDAELEGGGHSDLVGELEAFADEHPLRERLRSQLMLALYRSGRQAEALQIYHDTRSRARPSSSYTARSCARIRVSKRDRRSCRRPRTGSRTSSRRCSAVGSCRFSELRSPS